MKNSTIVIIIVLILAAIGLFIFSRKNMLVIHTPPDTTQTENVGGCYAAGNGKDVYSLEITSLQGENVSGNLSFKNFEKDSSSGTFQGTYKNGILLADYTFASEGTTSVMQVIFKKVGDDFVRGYGDVDTATGTQFTDLNNITYDSASVLSLFKKGECGSKASDMTITSQKISETNFTGTMPIFAGSSSVAVQARTYVDQTVSDFRKQANTDVPALKLKFGNDAPPGHYEIDIDAKYIKGAQTESIALSVYTFTGGAHGTTIYKFFTALLSTGKIISLGSVIKMSEQNAFTAFVKKEILAWNPSGIYDPDNSGTSIFADDVNALKFSDFANFSIDDKNLNIYFDQYSIGPGSLGETTFPIALSKLSAFMNASF